MAKPACVRNQYHPNRALANFGRIGGRSGKSENFQHPSSNLFEVGQSAERRVPRADHMPYGHIARASYIGPSFSRAEAHLWDPDRGAYRDSPRGTGAGWERLYPNVDGALPAGNAVAARVHLRLGHRDRAARILADARPPGPARRAYASFARALLALASGEGAR